MKKNTLISIFSLICIVLTGCNKDKNQSTPDSSFNYSKIIAISTDVLRDKIRGGWAGQVIGCTYGGPTEFKFCGTMIQDYTPIPWDENRMQWYFDNVPGLYDDIYMDLTFVEIFEKEGLDAPAESHAHAFANAEYKLWHANQAARYNILNGIAPPASGYWENNPHSEDIDFQIEADFAGLMSPGMVNTSSTICDKIGHIMNYGDGWYGGVYVAAMYALAFISDNVEWIVTEALKTIPVQSDFYQCINDVIAWHRQNPEDWKQTWFEVEKKWSSDIGCPSGVFHPFNIDAKINAAYIIIGMLYGNGDFGESIDISTRCGQDSDCNPASVAGILGTMIGYSNIPDYWKMGIDKVEDRDFKYTAISLNDVYQISYRHAMQNIERNGGKIDSDNIHLTPQKPAAVQYEKGFKNHYPVEQLQIEENNQKLFKENTEHTFEFEGVGFVLRGRSAIDSGNRSGDYDHLIELYVDDELIETIKLPTDFTRRRNEICWKYNLEKRNHVVTVKLINPKDGYHLRLYDALIYDNQALNSF
ncbi:MAG TPA: hypothetical protein DHW42_04915 [Candidatus Marinimicrobia bacterium]|nr:hypothetical protein [Candidatus Neomarinimicrobiota bacterium]